jgi:hypothetical protein
MYQKEIIEIAVTLDKSCPDIGPIFRIPVLRLDPILLRFPKKKTFSPPAKPATMSPGGHEVFDLSN